ncbi:hypothetical protein KSZ_10620 [Dictyobacter formicarum]|uniref:Uncharacterized protein n=1 Tax=Dictyobacter formicarum TaxID=2778368 RepID=A0ABQ3VD16_9CHLR|nr:hypothetical protein KSZ_10620 [Dictyobacter formicarum]
MLFVGLRSIAGLTDNTDDLLHNIQYIYQHNIQQKLGANFPSQNILIAVRQIDGVRQ